MVYMLPAGLLLRSQGAQLGLNDYNTKQHQCKCTFKEKGTSLECGDEKKIKKQQSKLSRKLYTSNEYEKISKKQCCGLNCFVLHFFSCISCKLIQVTCISSDCKNYCCALKAYEVTLLSKLTSFFWTKFLIIDHTSHLK